jgi:hypothetical protein
MNHGPLLSPYPADAATFACIFLRRNAPGYDAKLAAVTATHSGHLSDKIPFIKTNSGLTLPGRPGPGAIVASGQPKRVARRLLTQQREHGLVMLVLEGLRAERTGWCHEPRLRPEKGL